MLKLIVFDLDGVLVETKDIHFRALNSALRSINPDWEITLSEHLSTYDGLSTNKKLLKLNKDKNLPVVFNKKIWALKQQETIRELSKLESLPKFIEIFKKLKELNLKIAIASNAIRETIEIVLERIGVRNYVDFILSNEDVNNQKPHPEIYLKSMIVAGVGPLETLIVEDSAVGRKAANASCANILPVNSPSEVTLSGILSIMNHINKDKKQKWVDKSLNILIPMAGAGSRFEQVGYTFPKPLIPIKNFDDKPMIQLIVENLNIDANYIFIVNKQHYEKFSLKYLLNLVAPNCKIICVDNLTEGAACSAMLAKEYIDNNNPLLIANCDQYIEWDSNDFCYVMNNNKCSGSILTFTNTHPKWSYVKTDSDGFITEIKEKQVISNIANVGIYYWKHGSDFVKSTTSMIAKNLRVNNEFYIAPTYNELIAEGYKIKNYHINKMWGIGTPEDLEFFVKNYEANLS